MKSLLLLLVLAVAIPSPAQASGDGILLATGGGPGSTQFFVHLNPAGLLTVDRRDMLADPASTETQLSKEQAVALVQLAADADDFSVGCNKVGDGTNAEMKVVKAGTTSVYSCRGADQWPEGPHTKAFLGALNGQLPEEFHVF